MQYIMLKWPASVEDELKPYWNGHMELSTHVGCILWALRIVVLPQGWSTVLAELHRAHPEMTRKKALYSSTTSMVA